MASGKQIFSLDSFYRFCAHLKVNTKELGEIRLSKENMLGTQIYFLEEISKGLAEGIHEFVVLKGRQVSISTICLALDLYWVGKHGGIGGAFVTQDEPTRDNFKIILTQMVASLPKLYRIVLRIHNAGQMIVSGNRKTGKAESRLMYLIAGKTKNSGLGKSTASTFAHMTEVSEYGDPEGLASLVTTFAQNNPVRLFIWESTAQGYNHFYDTWEAAKKSSTKKAIFVGWWRNHLYKKKRGTKEHEFYWDNRLTPEERKWVREVKQVYDFDIDDEQIAWWRWMRAENMGDDQYMYQNFPPTEHYAFVKTGSQFFSGARVNDEYKKAVKLKPSLHRFLLNDDFESTELVNSSERLQNMLIWQEPVPGAVYAIGADPAWGSSQWKDRFCAQVYRCYSDGMDQVAEFCTAECTPAQFAWVILYLGAIYLSQNQSVGMLNLELNGPGSAVLNEINNVRRLAAMSQTDAGRKIYSITYRIETYLYKRQDSSQRATAYHTFSSPKEKERILTLFCSGFEHEMIGVRSRECLDEMRRVIRDEGFIGAPNREKDDRVLASALAVSAWNDYLRARLMQMAIGGMTRAEAQKRDSTAGEWKPTHIQNFIQERLRGG